MERIGAMIRERRLSMGLSMEKVARRADITYKSVLNIEHGGDTTTKVLFAVCDVLGLEVSLKVKENSSWE